MAAHFVLRKSGQQFDFVLKAGNGETILSSERYASKQGAEGGIASVRTNAPNESRYDRRESNAKQPYFVLKAANGEVIGTSQMYSSTSARDKGIESVQANAPTATVTDAT